MCVCVCVCVCACVHVRVCVQVADTHPEYELLHPLIAAWQVALSITEPLPPYLPWRHVACPPHATSFGATWQEALNIERMSYAEQFEKGEMGADASARLESILSVTQASVNAIASGINEQSTPSIEYALPAVPPLTTCHANPVNPSATCFALPICLVPRTTWQVRARDWAYRRAVPDPKVGGTCREAAI